jgi:hypothetical protein
MADLGDADFQRLRPHCFDWNDELREKREGRSACKGSRQWQFTGRPGEQH